MNQQLPGGLDLSALPNMGSLFCPFTFISSEIQEKGVRWGPADGVINVRENGDREWGPQLEPPYLVPLRGEAALSQCSNQGAGRIAGGPAL